METALHNAGGHYHKSTVAVANTRLVNEKSKSEDIEFGI